MAQCHNQDIYGRGAATLYCPDDERIRVEEVDDG